MVAALTANPAEFTSSIVANSALVALMNDGLMDVRSTTSLPSMAAIWPRSKT